MSDDALARAIAVFAGTPDAPPPTEIVPTGPARDALSDHDGQLIMELVANLRPRKDVLTRYNLTENDIVAKSRNPEWQARFREVHSIWNSDKNLKERIRAKAAFLLEDALVHLYKIVTSGGSAAAKLEAIEKLIKISTVANVPKEDSGVGIGGTRITINFGNRKAELTAENDNDRVVATINPTAA